MFKTVKDGVVAILGWLLVRVDGEELDEVERSWEEPAAAAANPPTGKDLLWGLVAFLGLFGFLGWVWEMGGR